MCLRTVHRSAQGGNAGAGPYAKYGLAHSQNWVNTVPSGDVVQRRVGCVRCGGGPFTTLDIVPLAGGQPGTLGTHTLGVVIGWAPRVLEMNPVSSIVVLGQTTCVSRFGPAHV